MYEFIRLALRMRVDLRSARRNFAPGKSFVAFSIFLIFLILEIHIFRIFLVHIKKSDKII